MSELIQCKERSEYGPLKLELLLHHLVQMLRLWRRSSHIRLFSRETIAEDGLVYPHSSLPNDRSSSEDREAKKRQIGDLRRTHGMATEPRGA